jgi:hypothetical protein
VVKGRAGGTDAGVHAGDNCQFASLVRLIRVWERGCVPFWRDREVAFNKGRGVLRVGSFYVCYVGHCDDDTDDTDDTLEWI